MEKRTCKTYDICDVDKIKIKIGTIEKDETWVIYAIGKCKITYIGEEKDIFKVYKEVINNFKKYLETEITNNHYLQNSYIGIPEISENNLVTKNYTKLEYELYVKLTEPKMINDIFPKIEPFFVKIYKNLKDTLINNGFTV